MDVNLCSRDDIAWLVTAAPTAYCWLLAQMTIPLESGSKPGLFRIIQASV